MKRDDFFKIDEIIIKNARVETFKPYSMLLFKNCKRLKLLYDDLTLTLKQIICTVYFFNKVNAPKFKIQNTCLSFVQANISIAIKKLCLFMYIF